MEGKNENESWMWVLNHLLNEILIMIQLQVWIWGFADLQGFNTFETMLYRRLNFIAGEET